MTTPNAQSTSAFLEITRRKAYIAMMIPHQIFVDDQKVGQVANGKTQRVEVSPGTHEIYVKQSKWVRTTSLSLDCVTSQTIRLQVTQNSPLKQLAMALGGGLLFLRKRDNLILERIPE